jgi:coenzyme PQQ precursor peptide PqqA
VVQSAPPWLPPKTTLFGGGKEPGLRAAVAAPINESHENHEACFMNIPYGRLCRARMISQTKIDPDHRSLRRYSMKWETPEAVDMRYGMEITMYISNR